MISKMQKTLVILVATMAIPLLFSACHKKVSFPNCKKDTDCHVDAQGNAQKGVCYMGKCEECVENSDCSGHKQCINHRCETTCHVDADCGANKHCEDNICHSDCGSGVSCPGDRVCSNGRCLSHLKMGQDPSSMAGCQNIESVHFGFDKYDVNTQGREQAHRLASCLEAHPALTLMIAGNTDNRGTPSYNMVLGEKRANAVKHYLESKGISSSRIKTVSFGEQKPVAEGNNEEAWAKNRRADFKLSN